MMNYGEGEIQKTNMAYGIEKNREIMPHEDTRWKWRGVFKKESLHNYKDDT